MKCRKPISIRKKGGAAFPCGSCTPCTINQRRVWTHRIMLESKLWPQNSFLTLTYRDTDLPADGVSNSEHQAFMKKLRAEWYLATQQKIRFYMCGEYGDKTFRPHYHYALFNFPSCYGPGPTWYGRKYVPCNCQVCSFVTSIWGKGHVFIGKLEMESAQYIAQYVTKKMTKKKDKRLKKYDHDPITGEITESYYNPEFSRASRNPGIASAAVSVIAAACKKYDREIPLALRHGNRHLPLGRYMKGKLYEETGEKPISLQALEAKQMFSLLVSTKNSPTTFTPKALGASFSAAVGMQLVNAQKCLQTEQRFNRKGTPHEI